MFHKPKKSLGQNFLKSIPALNMMCECGDISTSDTVVEIGPGKGALTEKLLEKAGRVIAIEKDQDLIQILKEKFKKEIENKNLELLEMDCLDFIPNNKYKIIANIPYNITGAILKKFLSEGNQPERMVLLVQKEVAERIVSRDKKESILSLSVKAYGEPKYIMKVHKRFFSPEPKVDSAIIAITNISKNNFKTKKDEENFFEIIKTSFAHKRKIFRKNLLENNKYKKEKVDELFERLNINPNKRAEDLPIDKWLEISSLLTKNI